MDDETLGQAYRQTRAHKAAHLTEEEWTALQLSEVSPGDRQRLLGHILACGDCTTVHRSLLALANGASKFDPASSPTSALVSVRSAPRSWWYAGGLAVAATIVAAVLLNVRPLAPKVSDDVTRSAGPGAARVSVVTPQPDAVLKDRRLAWSEVPGAERYEVVINGADGALIWTATTGATEAIIPAEQLSPGRYYWQIRALNQNGTFARSDLVAFRVD